MVMVVVICWAMRYAVLHVKQNVCLCHDLVLYVLYVFMADHQTSQAPTKALLVCHCGFAWRGLEMATLSKTWEGNAKAKGICTKHM